MRRSFTKVEEDISALMIQNRLSGKYQTDSIRSVLSGKQGPKLVARDSNAEAAVAYQRLAASNQLKNALLLGTPASFPGAVSSLAGQDEHKVAAAHEIGGAIYGAQAALAGIPSRGPFSVAPRTGLITETFTVEQINATQIPARFKKSNGGTTASDFINLHAANRHMFNPDIKSTSTKTQFGRDVNVKTLMEDTLLHPDAIFEDPVQGTTRYSKNYPFNISTQDTPTGKMRVFINKTNPVRSTQFPRYPKK